MTGVVADLATGRLEVLGADFTDEQVQGAVEDADDPSRRTHMSEVVPL